MRQYVRENLEDSYGILDFQDELLKIMVYIDSFCNANRIDYCLMAGSALGAERHHGYIPWDDDIDIYMSSSDYDKFKKAFNESGDKDKYYLQEYGSTHYKKRDMITMAKVKLNGSMIEEVAFKGWKVHQGIFVDIFIVHNMPEKNVQRISQYLWSEAVVLKGLSVRGYKSKSLKDFFMLTIANLLPTKWILNHGLYNAYKYDDIETSHVMGFFDTRKYSRAVFRRELIFPTKYSAFETVQLRVPANNKEYLRIQFGDDYMVPPPLDKRQINKHVNSWKLDEKIQYDYSDEVKLI